MQTKLNNEMPGKRFGRLVVIERHGSAKYGGTVWLCRCDCGAEKIARGQSLRCGDTRSCGCLLRENGHRQGKAHIIHGMEGTPTYVSWCSMIQRCTNPKTAFYDRYGGRGIMVCQRWLNSFKAFLDDMGPKPPGTTLERKNGDGHYNPNNCKWAGHKEQAFNRRSTIAITRDGRTMCLNDWCAELGVSAGSVYTRACQTGKPHVEILERAIARKAILASRVAGQLTKTK